MVQWYVEIRLFAMCTFPIIQLVCPPKLCITFAFNFSWVLQLSQEKNNEDNAHAKIWGANAKHGALCEMCKWQIPVLYIVAFHDSIKFILYSYLGRKIKGPKIGCILSYMSKEGGRHTPHNAKTTGWAVTAPS